MKCPNCGNEIQDQFNVCMYCGTVIQIQPEKKKPLAKLSDKLFGNPVDKKKVTIVGAAALVVVLLIGLLAALIGGLGRSKHTKHLLDAVVYQKDGIWYIADGEGKNQGVISDFYHAMMYDWTEDKMIVSADGRYLVCPDEVLDHNRGYSLCYCDLTDTSMGSMTIDTYVYDHQFSEENSEILFYCKNREIDNWGQEYFDLYMYNMVTMQSTQLATGVTGLDYSKDGMKVLCMDKDANGWCISIDGEKMLVGSHINNLAWLDSDKDIVCFSCGDLYSQKLGGSKVETIGKYREIIGIYGNELYFITKDLELCCYDGRKTKVLMKDYSSIYRENIEEGTFIAVRKTEKHDIFHIFHRSQGYYIDYEYSFYRVCDGKATKIRLPEEYQQMFFDDELCHAFYVVDGEKSGYVLYELDLRTNRRTKIDKDITSYVATVTDLGVVYYKNNNDIYVNGKFIASDIFNSGVYDGVLYLLGLDGTLYSYRKGKMTMLMENVDQHYILGNGSVAALANADYREGSFDLYVVTLDGEVTLVEEGAYQFLNPKIQFAGPRRVIGPRSFYIY